MSSRLVRLLSCLACLLPALAAAQEVRLPGARSETLGYTANTWALRPAGRLFTVGEGPQGCLLSPDRKLLAVANCGWGKQSVQLYEVPSGELVATVPILRPQAVFHGLAFSPDGSKLYVSGGPTDVIRVIDLPATDQSKAVELPLKAQPTEPVVDNPETFAGKITLPDATADKTVLYPIGVTVSPDGQTLWVAETLGRAVSQIRLSDGQVIRRIPVGSYPFEIAFGENGTRAYISLWGEAKVAVVDVARGVGLVQLPVGKHPCTLVADPSARRVYVANAHSDSVSVIDTAANQVVGTISVAPYEGAPTGSQPNALALSADGATLYVADGGNNCYDIIDLNAARTGGVIRGRVPTGWYPTGLQVAPDGTVWVVSAKGLGSGQNAYPKRRYVGTFLIGLGQAVPPPTAGELAELDRQVRDNNYVASGANVRLPAAEVTRSPIPQRLGDPSPIQYCLYIIKENRTYDQVFGDLPQGNGDEALAIYGRKVTPNQHRLAEEYVLLDNFYCDGYVSVDGHQWAKGAQVSDAVEKSWPLSYSQRGPVLGGPVSAPAGGWLWERATEHGVSSKVYSGGIDPGQDLKRVDLVLGDYGKWEAAGEGTPRLVVLHLPNNHTLGTAKGKPRPAAMVAENDLAVGRLIEGLSKLKIWSQMAVFIVEDDAQDGPDHVDCHRSPALVVSPWVKRGVVDSNFYDQCAVVRTIGLILGLKPLSQFDAAAMPLVTVFAERPTVTPYVAVDPEQRLDEMNALGAYGQEESDQMDFAEVDIQPWPTFNRILWHDAKGADVPYPGTRNAIFQMAVRPPEDDDDD